MEPRTKPYLLSGGLVPLLENRHKVKLSEETKEQIRTLEHAYFTEAHYLLSGRSDNDKNGLFFWRVEFIQDKEIEEGLRSLIEKNRTDKPLISFDDVYCVDLVDGIYDVTRIQDPNDLDAKPLSGPRAGSLPLEEQIRGIAKKHGANIDVMDIGAFGGETLCGEIDRFGKVGVKINNVNLYFAGQEGLECLRNKGINVNKIQVYDWVDWLEIRDCMGFDGRKVHGTEYQFVRYIENSKKWASIPEEIKERYEHLYHTFFNLVRACLRNEGYDVNLKPSPDNHKVHILKIKKR